MRKETLMRRQCHAVEKGHAVGKRAAERRQLPTHDLPQQLALPRARSPKDVQRRRPLAELSAEALHKRVHLFLLLVLFRFLSLFLLFQRPLLLPQDVETQKVNDGSSLLLTAGNPLWGSRQGKARTRTPCRHTFSRHLLLGCLECWMKRQFVASHNKLDGSMFVDF